MRGLDVSYFCVVQHFVWSLFLRNIVKYIVNIGLLTNILYAVSNLALKSKDMFNKVLAGWRKFKKTQTNSRRLKMVHEGFKKANKFLEGSRWFKKM